MAASFQGFRSLIENSHDAISLLDRRGEILYGSASTTKLFGYQPEEIVGRNCIEMIHPEDRDHSSRALLEVVAKPPGPLHWDARVRHKDGRYSWVETTLWNLLVELEVQAIVMLQRDIDARKAAEAASLRHTVELGRANKRLIEFAYTAAHDLREPLHEITLCTKMMARQTPGGTNTAELSKYIVASAARMATLIDDLLTFASTGIEAPPGRVEIEHCVAQAMQNLGCAIQASGAVVTVGPLPVVESNEIQMVRLFQNLLSNAVKFRGQRPAEIHVSARRVEMFWVIEVEDNGLGIAPEHQARVFRPFLRLVGREIPGSGLGLAVCQRIVEGWGGTIWLESKPGSGSKFSFAIPIDVSASYGT